MRPFPAISVIGTGALAFGLVFAPGASAAPVPASPGPQGEATMLEALARDLGLTPPGAETLLEAQEEALKTDAEAAEAAGDAYGGSLFDIETHDLTVLVTDADAAAAVEAAGAQARVVEHGADGLAEIVEALDAEGAPQGVTGWYPDVAGDTVVIEVLEGAGQDVTGGKGGGEPGDCGGSFISGCRAQVVTGGGSGEWTSGGTSYCQEGTRGVGAWGLRLWTG